MSHGNARTTVHGRMLIVARHRSGMPKSHIAKAMGISLKCVSHWIARYAAEGEAGLSDRTCRPHTTPTRTCAQTEQQVLALRATQRRGQDWIGPELGLAPRTVGRILRRHQMPYLRELDSLTGALIRSSSAWMASRVGSAGGADTVLEGHRGALRTPAPGRTGAHGCEEARADP